MLPVLSAVQWTRDRDIIICSDSSSLLASLQMTDLQVGLYGAHCGVRANEMAARAAEEATNHRLVTGC